MNHSTSPTVILGGGFTGLFTALHLCHQRYPQPVVLIDQMERFVFKPLLYELLSGEMSTNQVWPHYEDLLNCSGVTFVQDSIQEIDLRDRQVKLASGLQYDYGNLVLAVGSTASYFGIVGAKEHTLPFRTGEDALALKKHLRECLQRASQTEDETKRRSLLTIAIIGAGPAGVEMAATLADLLPQWYHKLNGDPQEIRVVILNRSKEILKGDINGHLREVALKALRQRTVPVEVLPEASASGIFADRVEYKQHGKPQKLAAETIIWTAGNEVHPLIKSLPIAQTQRDGSGRLRVTSTLQLPEFPEVFAGGDCAVLDNPLPATAQVAYQQGAAIAHNLSAIAQGHQLKPAMVALRGTLIKLGLGEGVANLFERVAITGRSGHLIRQGTYLELLPTPVHNFKATVAWLTDELFQRHSRHHFDLKSMPTMPRSQVRQWAGNAAAVLVLMSSGLLLWRTVQPTQFKEALRPTGLPALLDRVEQGQTPSQN